MSMYGVLQVLGTQALIFGGWSIIDAIGTKIILEALYKIPIARFQLKRPPPRTLAAKSHFETARILVALAYFLYCAGRIVLYMEPSVYKALEIDVTASDTAIKRRFRELAKMYHPDKVGEEHADVFRLLHEKYSLISDPDTRLLYNMFGPRIALWERLSTQTEYIHNGFKELVYQHISMLLQQGLGLVLHLNRWTSRSMNVGSMWALLLQSCVFIFQMRMLTDERWSTWLGYATGLAVFQAVSMITNMLFPCILLLQQCNISFDQLLTAGSWKHFRFARDPQPVLIESPDMLAKAHVLHTLRREPETISEAREQINILVAAVKQLDESTKKISATESDS